QDTFTVSNIAAPSIPVFAASPSTIIVGNSSQLSWTVGNGTTVTIDQGVCADCDNPSGTHNVSPGSTVTYTLTAENSGGQTSAQATVTVNPPLTCGADSNMTFSSIGGDDCRGTYTTIGGSTITLPSNWSNTNTIEVTGGGGGGSFGSFKNGGGGGAYSS